MAYSYDDFVAAANKAGLMNEFSQSDLTTAQQHPEFGMSILGFKQDVHKATTQEGKMLAHQAAEELRKSYGNYTGGETGSRHKSAGKIPGQVDSVLDQIYNYQPTANPYQSQYQDALDKITSFGDFSYGDAPTYENQYQEQQKALLDAIINREDFSWSKDQDPLWPVYKKEYLREGERATADALGQAAAASGGRASTAAVTAATQAGDYYATKLNDIIPTLYQQAYDKYLNEYQMKLSDLGAVNTQEQMDYTKYLDQLGQYNTDRNFSYQKYLDDFTRQLQGLDALESAQRLNQDLSMNDFSILQGKLSSLQSQDGVDYARYLDQLTRQDQAEQMDYQRQLADREFQQSQLDAILAAGGTPTAEMIAASGYDQTYVNALREAYLRQQSEKAAKAASGRSSSGGGKSGGGDAVSAFQAGDHSDATIQALLEAGYTEADIVGAGYTGNYFRKSGGGGSAPTASNGDYGGSYNTIWPRARTMFDQGKSTQEIMAYLDKFSEEQLTDAGLDYIMNSLNLNGYREAGGTTNGQNTGTLKKKASRDTGTEKRNLGK